MFLWALCECASVVAFFGLTYSLSDYAPRRPSIRRVRDCPELQHPPSGAAAGIYGSLPHLLGTDPVVPQVNNIPCRAEALRGEVSNGLAGSGRHGRHRLPPF